ncbi:TIGR03089 family protein [Nocardiopsis lambiniae]|uniref:TIGR03089 family protein n=1 Tax=Nocardiopsis lambiniae TaxID=3075539 RepID=A0ABU2MGB7_9ACTN|nr:TIGR03089 family protein [Nocardiopsis sp. DSM 44743]MDT0331617.1 TIGR03089 family protein [Nocardiopsis sp. DSM 44743]
MSETPAQLWRDLVAADPTRPFTTSYDASGGRVELSRATFDNWVSKTANMLVDGFGAQPGDRVVLALPVHWQSLVWLTACWSVGAIAEIATGPDLPEGALVAVADADRLEAALDSGAEEVVGTSLHPLGLPLREVPPMVQDYSVEVRAHGDRFSPYPVDPGTPALRVDADRSGADLVADARSRAERWGLTDADRMALFAASDEPLRSLGQGAELLLGPMAAGAPIVLTPFPAETDAESVRKRLESERVTVMAAGGGGTVFGDLPFRRISLTD